MTKTSSFSMDLFRQAPVVGIIRNQSAEDCYRIAETMLEVGLYTLEVTMNTPDVAGIITGIKRRFPELNTGAGTVCTPAELEQALAAGADFIVTPVLDEQVITTCVNRGVPVFPGAYTPTEIYRAWSLGATAVKVFPASQLGTKYIKDLSGPLPQIKLIPTGGVSMQNIASFFEAGVVGVGMGSSLLNKDLIAAGNFSGLRKHFESILQAIPASALN